MGKVDINYQQLPSIFDGGMIEFIQKNGQPILVNAGGQILFMTVFELSSTRVLHFRKSPAIWDLLAMVGGFNMFCYGFFGVLFWLFYSG